MSGATSVTAEDQGQITLSSEVRARRNWILGTTLVLVETPDGLLLTEHSTALARIRAVAGDSSAVDELLAERRREAAAKDAST